jgi:hypothetical protein
VNFNCFALSPTTPTSPTSRPRNRRLLPVKRAGACSAEVRGSNPLRSTNKSLILRRFQLSVPFVALARGCGPWPGNFGLSAGHIRRTGAKCAPCLWRRNLCFRRGGGRFPKETSVRDARARFEATRTATSPLIGEDSTTSVGLALRRPTRSRAILGCLSRPEARRACVKNECLAVDRRESGGTPQTQGARLIGEARGEIHEACDAVAAWEGA